MSRNSRNHITFRFEKNIEWIRETRDFWNIFRPTKACHQTTLHSRSDVTTVNEHYEIHFNLCCLMKPEAPGACNRSTVSKLLSITTQLHCGGHLGGRARLPDTILEEDHPMSILSKFGSRQEDFYVKLSSAVATILVGVLKCQTYFWKGTTQGSFQQSFVEIGSVVSEEKIIFFNFIPFFF